jgi:acetate kinase
MPEGEVLAKGLAERIGEKQGRFTHQGSGEKKSENLRIPNHNAGLEAIVHYLTTDHPGEPAAIRHISEIAAIGHRVVHGGEAFSESVLITPQVERAIERCVDLAPLHNPPNLEGIRAAKKFFRGVPQVACFDTAFHATLPKPAYLYALPQKLYEKYRVRRYGFHGISHRYVSQRAAELLKKKTINAITCHLGNGCSVCAIRDGKSIDTSMGLTPLEGLVMGTRSGDIDPAIIFYLSDKKEYKTLGDINALLLKESGLLGISGHSNDVRTLVEAAEKGHARAALALEIFAYRARKYIGAYAAALPKLGAIVFTGGIGENAASVRAMILTGLDSNLNIALDRAKNDKAVGGAEADISAPGSKARVLVVPTNEEKAIAADAWRISM